MRLAVVGHCEWADVLWVERFPAAGEWIETSSLRSEPAGAGGTAARQIAKLAGSATFFTSLADDELSRRSVEQLSACEIDVHGVTHVGLPQRRAFVVVDSNAERTIMIHGQKLCPKAEDDLPWKTLDAFDGVCFVCGDAGSVAEARRARILVATARWLPVLKQAGVRLDALVQSATDPDEQYVAGDLDPPPGLLVTTAGAIGGTYSVAGQPERPFAPAPLPARSVDSYGAGDSFLAGLTVGLARGDKPEAAIELAARCGAAVVTSAGISGQLEAEADAQPR